MKISKRLVVAAVACLGLTATAAIAQTSMIILYDTVYYSDATHTVEVGRNYGVCYGGMGNPIWAGSSQYTDGQTTSFYANVRVGRCTANGPELE